jgi:polyphosphate kinase 2 (PPK2 family)
MKKLLAQFNEFADQNTGKIAIVLEGRDTAGKSSTIRELTHYLNPAWYSVVPSRKPSKRTMNNWLGYWQTKCQPIAKLYSMIAHGIHALLFNM